MFANFYFKIPRRIRILVILLIVALIIFFVIRFLAVEPKNVPSDFLKARQEASSIAADIVKLSDDSVKQVDEISQLDQDKKYTEALQITSQELERNREARQKAIDLSTDLQTMAQNIAQISPQAAGQRALEAVTAETTLISRLITYNDYLSQLLDALRAKFLGKGDGNQISDLVNKLNNEASAINDLNRKFNDAMKEFDAK